MVVVRTVESSGEADRALDLAERVWGQRPLSPPVLRAMELAGSYVAVAVDGDELVGMCAGLVGIHDDDGHHAHLHSHLAAVAPGHRGRGVGRALKRHQRTWCLERDIATVSWTFDPLVVENGRFNLHHLGAVGVRYLVDLYGPMDDEINRGDPSDRLLVRWDLTSERTVLALDGRLPPPDTAGAVLIPAPSGIVGLRQRDPEAARRRRHEVRDAMTAAFDAGAVVTGVTDDGAYVLRPEEAP